MFKLGELVFAIGLALSATFPAMAQQTQQQMPMMGHGTMMGGQGMMNPGMMNPGSRDRARHSLVLTSFMRGREAPHRVD